MSRFRSVLLVDDSRADNFLHRQLIREAQFADTIDVASDGAEALERLRAAAGDPTAGGATTGRAADAERPAVIFLDIFMPRMDGFEFLEAYEKLPEPQRGSLVIVMLTTSLDPADRERALATGLVTEFVNKPLSVADLKRLKHSIP